MRASIVPEPEVRVISPPDKPSFDDGRQPQTEGASLSGVTTHRALSRRRSSSVGSLSEGSGGVRRTPAGSVLEIHSSRHSWKGPNVADGGATSQDLKGNVIVAPAELMSLRRPLKRSHSKLQSTALKTSSLLSSSSSSKKKWTKHEGAKQEGTTEAHSEKDATKPGTSSSSGKTLRTSTASATGLSVTKAEHNEAADHTQPRPSSYAARSKGLPEKDANAKTQAEKGHAKSRTSSFSEATRRTSTASTTGPCALGAAVSAVHDEVRPAAPAPVAAKITGTTVDPASTKESHRSSSSTIMPGVTVSKDHASSRSHKRRASSSRRDSSRRVSKSTASDGPAVAAVSHGQAPAHAPGEEEVISKAPSSALAPHSKPPDTMIAASTTRSQNQPSCSVAAPVRIAAPAVSQEVVVPHTSRNGKASEAAAYASAPWKIQCAAPSATSSGEDDKMASRDKDVARGGKAAVDEQTTSHQPAGSN
ncbi:prophage side tail fiber protein homolog StfR-like [Dermacentor albipictus]|uniref:prophage side tail fiber protein homolog StfR-like n=1 Tax=Dermacentor albipictus TaxID=60249 RepID=UPI0031FDB326